MAGSATIAERERAQTPVLSGVEQKLVEFIQVFSYGVVPRDLLLPCEDNKPITSHIDMRDHFSPKGVRRTFDIVQRSYRVDVSLQLQFESGDNRKAILNARLEPQGWTYADASFYSKRAHPIPDDIDKEEAYHRAEEAFGLPSDPKSSGQ